MALPSRLAGVFLGVFLLGVGLLGVGLLDVDLGVVSALAVTGFGTAAEGSLVDLEGVITPALPELRCLITVSIPGVNVGKGVW